MTLVALTGLSSGALHAVSGPDHVLSLAPLSVGQRHGAWRIGFAWGIGHALGTCLAAVALFCAVSMVSLQGLNVWAERIAGVALIVMGVLALRRRSGSQCERQSTVPRGVVLVGCLHGLTGAAALLLLLPVAFSASVLDKSLYLAGFSIGTTAAMAGLTASLAVVQRGRTLARWMQRLPVASSVASMALGAFWIIASA